MVIDKRYVVTKASDDETFLIGDTIWLTKDGCIMCKEGGGWIDKENVPEAMKGMECVVDKKYLDKKIKALEDELNKLKEIKNGTEEN